MWFSPEVGSVDSCLAVSESWARRWPRREGETRDFCTAMGLLQNGFVARAGQLVPPGGWKGVAGTSASVAASVFSGPSMPRRGWHAFMSEEGRVGKECVGTFRARGWPEN